MKWIKEHLLISGIIGSTLFALIIHGLFSTPAPTDWFVAKWGAGDILTYASTVALGLLAVWQNKRFKDEGDKSQKRMEALANKANELAVISKIIEREGNKISQLRQKSQNFIDSCNTENASIDIADVANQPDDFKKIYVKIKMDNRCAQIRYWGIELLYELGLYSTDAKAIELSKLVTEYSNASLALVKEIRTSSNVDATYTQKKDIEKQFITQMFNFISERENLLNDVTYGNLSVEQIKAMYGKSANKNERP